MLPECAVTGEAGPASALRAVTLEGEFGEAFAAKARQHGTYIVAPTYLHETDGRISNAAVLFGRQGEVVGAYRKVHLVVGADGSFENGCTPGGQVPVFECDFGKLGIQICYDMEFDYGWEELRRQGAELVVFTTQSPQTSHPASRAMAGGCYIVSSNWRSNATVFEPTGKISAQVLDGGGGQRIRAAGPGRDLVCEIDLEYMLLPWHPALRNGAALRERYGDAVGFNYYDDEDNGIFWSNDESTPVADMAAAIGVSDVATTLARVRDVYRERGVGGYRREAAL